MRRSLLKNGAGSGAHFLEGTVPEIPENGVGLFIT
jgi:hypothetical protein